MGMVVRSNIMAVNANRQLGMNNSQVSKSLEKLSSGFKINRAGDDASGLAISEKMKAQIKGLETASANSQDGVSLIQTAEGALTEVHDMLNRMVELSGKAANGTMDTDVDRASLQKEMDSLLDEIDRIAESTNFNGIKLLNGELAGTSKVADLTFGTQKFKAHAGNDFAGSVQILAVDLSGATGEGSIKVEVAAGSLKISLDSKAAKDYSADDINNAVRAAVEAKLSDGSVTGADDIAKISALKSFRIDAKSDLAVAAGDDTDTTAKTVAAGGAASALTLQIGDTADNYNKVDVAIADMSVAGLGITALKIDSQDAAAAALDKVKTGATSAINTVSSARADLGALQNRLEHTINNLDVAAENMTAANSRIRDTDMAKQMMEYTKQNVLTQAAQAMLAQANQQPQSVLQLLQ